MQETRGPEAPVPPVEPLPYHSRRRYRVHSGVWFPVLLILVGIMVLVGETGALWWWTWAVFWPMVLIALGLLILARRLR